MENQISVYIRVDEGGKLPQYSSPNAAGCDLFATEDMVLRPGEVKLMPLNFVIAIPEEMEAQVRPRSGLSLNTKLRIPNSPGTVDSDFRNTVGIIFENTYNISNLAYEIAGNPNLLKDLAANFRTVKLKDYLLMQNKMDLASMGEVQVLNQTIYLDKYNNPYGTIYIEKGQRIAQMVFSEYKRACFINHDHPESIGEDRGGGFGHTGTN